MAKSRDKFLTEDLLKSLEENPRSSYLNSSNTLLNPIKSLFMVNSYENEVQ